MPCDARARWLTLALALSCAARPETPRLELAIRRTQPLLRDALPGIGAAAVAAGGASGDDVIVLDKARGAARRMSCCTGGGRGACAPAVVGPRNEKNMARVAALARAVARGGARVPRVPPPGV